MTLNFPKFAATYRYYTRKIRGLLTKTGSGIIVKLEFNDPTRPNEIGFANPKQAIVIGFNNPKETITLNFPNANQTVAIP